MNDESEGAEFGLMMPFVAVTSKGGPYDDQAYVAGWEAATYAVKLRAARALGLGLCEGWVRTPNVAQLDLVAMEVGAQLVRPAAMPDADGWSYVRFVWVEP